MRTEPVYTPVQDTLSDWRDLHFIHQVSVGIWACGSCERALYECIEHVPMTMCLIDTAGQAMATCSYDGTWRLWDVATGASLVEQEGHSRAVYAAAFHPDGSLCASGGLDAVTRVWDCRSGRNVLTFQGHARGILSVAFSTNGYHAATGGLVLLQGRLLQSSAMRAKHPVLDLAVSMVAGTFTSTSHQITPGCSAASRDD
jgi:WD40 repeat protein